MLVTPVYNISKYSLLPLK